MEALDTMLYFFPVFYFLFFSLPALTSSSPTQCSSEINDWIKINYDS